MDTKEKYEVELLNYENWKSGWRYMLWAIYSTFPVRPEVADSQCAIDGGCVNSSLLSWTAQIQEQQRELWRQFSAAQRSEMLSRRKPWSTSRIISRSIELDIFS